jgi:N-acetylmuramoyl-L-alanine amidase
VALFVFKSLPYAGLPVIRRTLPAVFPLLLVLLAGCPSTPARRTTGDPPPLSMVPLDKVAARLGLKPSSPAGSDVVVLSGKRGTVVFNPRVRGVLIGNGSDRGFYFRRHRVVVEGGRVSLPERFFEACDEHLAPHTQPAPEPGPTEPERRFHVIIDPGHGGRDPGAVGLSGAYEKTVNLVVSRLVAEALREAGMQVTMTRSKDVFVELNERAAIGNRLGADAFISIHADASSNRRAQGFTMYVCHTKYSDTSRAGLICAECRMPAKRCRAVLAGNRGRSRKLASHIREHMREATDSPDRGTRLGALRVLRRSACPAVLVELGFMSNAEEEARLLRPEYRRALAAAVAGGAKAFLDGE